MLLSFRRNPLCVPAPYPVIILYQIFDHKHIGEKMKPEKHLRLSRRATDVLLAHPYPGNVRELMNLFERLVVMTDGDRADLEDLPQNLRAPVD